MLDAVDNPADAPDLKAASARAQAAFEFVLANGPKIQTDHYLVYHARA